MPRFILLMATVVIGLCLSGTTYGDDRATQLNTLVEKAAPSICTVKVVLRQENPMMGGAQESTMEAQGAVETPAAWW